MFDLFAVKSAWEDGLRERRYLTHIPHPKVSHIFNGSNISI